MSTDRGISAWLRTIFGTTLGIFLAILGIIMICLFSAWCSCYLLALDLNRMGF